MSLRLEMLQVARLAPKLLGESTELVRDFLLQQQNSEGGFKDRDLYPSCSGPDGKIVAHPDASRIGLVRADVKDVAGKAYGAEMVKVAEEGKFAEVNYMFPRPGADKTPVQKVSYVTKVAGYVCFVGVYK